MGTGFLLSSICLYERLGSHECSSAFVTNTLELCNSAGCQIPSMSQFSGEATAALSDVPGNEDAATAALLAGLPRRLNACLAAAGVSANCVATINGAPADGWQLVYPGDVVAVDGAPIAWTGRERRSRVHAYHKLKGNRTEDIKPPGCEGLWHVGQLDRKTTGLLLFTDDSELSRLVLCPGLLPKTYVVEVDGPRAAGGLSDEQMATLQEKRPLPQNVEERRKGRNKRGAPVGFETVVYRGSTPWGDATLPPGCTPKSRFSYEVAVESGANHVVKRLFDRVGRSVMTLHRSSIGPVGLDLAPGAARALTSDEVSALWAAVGGDTARAALRRAALLCAARAGTDERLRGFFGPELVGGECYAAFPGFSCKHSKVNAEEKRAALERDAPRLDAARRSNAEHMERAELARAADMML